MTRLAVCVCFVFVIFACTFTVETRRVGGGSSRTGSSSRGSWGGGGSSSRTSYQASNNWSKAKDRISAARPKPAPRPQPNPEHTRISYGQHEPSPTQNKPPPRTGHDSNTPQRQPNEDNAKLSYTPSAPPMPNGQISNKQTVNTNQHAPSAPPMEHSGHQQSAPSAPYPSGTNQAGQAGKPGANPIGWNVGQQNPSNPGQTNVGWNTNANPNTHTANANNQQSGNSRPIGFDNVNKQAAGGVQSQTPGQHSTNTHVNQNQNYPGYNQPGYNPQGGYNQPGYHPQGGYNQPGYHGYNQPGGYQQPQYNPQNPGYYSHPPNGYGSYGHPNYNYGGYGGYHGQGGGYTAFGGYNPPGTNIHYGPVTYINGHTPAPAYSYSYHSDNTLLSFFVGYQVAKMFSSTPSSYFGGHTYTVHHYHHDKKEVPEKITVQANVVVACAENITLLCLQNSYPVCMSNGTIMCVTSPQLTVKCSENNNLQCVTNVVDCNNNNTAPVCHDKNVTLTAQNTTTLSVPCVSSVSIYGDLTMLQNIINTTAPANTAFNMTTTNAPQGINVTMVTDNAAATTNSSETTTAAALTDPTTTTTTTTTAATPTQHITNVFCVTVLAVPAPLNQTAFNNLTAQAQVQSYPTVLAEPEVQDKMWRFFGDVFDHIFG